MPSGGKRKGAGRKSEADKKSILKGLEPFKADWFKAVGDGLKDGNYNFCRLYAEYMFGKPTEHVDVTSNNEPFILKLNGTKPEAK
jgi:hypothetical protein